MPNPTLRVAIVPVTPFQQNCSFIWCDATKKAAFIDAGGDIPHLISVYEEMRPKEGLTLEKLIITHGHVDHCGATADLAAHFGVPVEGPHPDEDWLLATLGEQGGRFGLTGRPVTPDRWVGDGDTVTVGEAKLDVFHCPGHTPGHVVYVDQTARFAFAGDVLFLNSIGRTDTPRGDYGALVSSIRRKLFPLGDDIRFVPGHGQLSSFGRERQFNPFVSDEAVGEIASEPLGD